MLEAFTFISRGGKCLVSPHFYLEGQQRQQRKRGWPLWLVKVTYYRVKRDLLQSQKSVNEDGPYGWSKET